MGPPQRACVQRPSRGSSRAPRRVTASRAAAAQDEHRSRGLRHADVLGETGETAAVLDARLHDEDVEVAVRSHLAAGRDPKRTIRPGCATSTMRRTSVSSAAGSGHPVDADPMRNSLPPRSRQGADEPPAAAVWQSALCGGLKATTGRPPRSSPTVARAGACEDADVHVPETHQATGAFRQRSIVSGLIALLGSCRPRRGEVASGEPGRPAAVAPAPRARTSEPYDGLMGASRRSRVASSGGGGPPAPHRGPTRAGSATWRPAPAGVRPRTFGRRSWRLPGRPRSAAPPPSGTCRARGCRPSGLAAGHGRARPPSRGGRRTAAGSRASPCAPPTEGRRVPRDRARHRPGG